MWGIHKWLRYCPCFWKNLYPQSLKKNAAITSIILIPTTYLHASEGLVLVLYGFCVEPEDPSLAPNMHFEIWEGCKKKRKIWEGRFERNESCLFFENWFCRLMALDLCGLTTVRSLKHCKSSFCIYNNLGCNLLSSFQRMQLFWRGFCLNSAIVLCLTWWDTIHVTAPWKS